MRKRLEKLAVWALLTLGWCGCARPSVEKRLTYVRPAGSDPDNLIWRCSDFCSHHNFRHKRGAECAGVVISPDGDERFECRAPDA